MGDIASFVPITTSPKSPLNMFWTGGNRTFKVILFFAGCWIRRKPRQSWCKWKCSLLRRVQHVHGQKYEGFHLYLTHLNHFAWQFSLLKLSYQYTFTAHYVKHATVFLPLLQVYLKQAACVCRAKAWLLIPNRHMMVKDTALLCRGLI